jgi:flagellar protein FliL
MAWNLLHLPVQMAQETEPDKPNDEAAPEAVAPKGGGKVGRLVSVVISHGVQFLLMVGAVLVGGMIAGKLDGAAHEEATATVEAEAPTAGKTAAKAAAKAPAKKLAAEPARYFALDPPLVVNLSEDGGVRYLQVNVEVMAREEKVIQAVQQNVPLIRNDLVQLLSDRPPAELMSRDGREKMRAEAQTAVNAILERESGGAQIETLLFTGFVVQ